MQLNDDKKVDVLLSALQERYVAIHNIRGRVQSIGIWVLGLLLGAGAWLVQSDIILTWSQKLLAIVGVTVALIVLRLVYLEDLRKGFAGQQRTAVHIEKALGLFTPGIFDNSDKTIFPATWEHAGTEDGDGKFFDSTCVLLYVGVAFLVLAILFHSGPIGCWYFLHHFR